MFQSIVLLNIKLPKGGCIGETMVNEWLIQN